MVAQSSEEREYPLSRDIKASLRLNFNHFWMKSLAGYLLHPKIPIKEDIRVADLGTGTGIWACELGATLPPSARIDAIDISADQFLPAGWNIPNVHFGTWDCFKPFSSGCVGQFDVLHIKFWLCIVNDDVADSLLKNFLTLLKPGGYIQWMDPLPNTARVRVQGREGPTPACDRLVRTWKKPAPHSSYDWVHNLPQLFSSNGLEIVTADKLENPDYFLPVAAQSSVVGTEEYVHKIPGTKEFLEELSAEYASGAFVDTAYTCVVGRKPSS